MSINLLVKLQEGAALPSRGTIGSAGLDLAAYEETYIYNSSIGDAVRVRTGVQCDIPVGYVGLLIERSSLHTRGISLANNVGVIDSDYRGEIQIALTAHSKMVKIKKGERLAQLILLAIPDINIVIVSKLDETQRGSSGFGSTHN